VQLERLDKFKKKLPHRLSNPRSSALWHRETAHRQFLAACSHVSSVNVTEFMKLHETRFTLNLLDEFYISHINQFNIFHMSHAVKSRIIFCIQTCLFNKASTCLSQWPDGRKIEVHSLAMPVRQSRTQYVNRVPSQRVERKRGLLLIFHVYVCIAVAKARRYITIPHMSSRHGDLYTIQRTSHRVQTQAKGRIREPYMKMLGHAVA
jgi:hypothetical protein